MFSQDSDTPTLSLNSQTTAATSHDGSHLAREPSIIKGKGGERLWHAEANSPYTALCKSQLKVISCLTYLINRLNSIDSSLHSRPRRILTSTGRNLTRPWIPRKDQRIWSASIARLFFFIPIVIHIKTQVE